MRLGQLARKLGVRTVEIVDYLAQHQIIIDDGFNSRVEDDHVGLVIQRFPPTVPTDLSPPFSATPQAATPELSTGPGKDVTKPDPAPSENDVAGGEIIGEEKIELIKAPKVELSGLKVLGKIELPEPKKKETPPEATEENTASPEPEKQTRRDFKKPYAPRRDRSNQPAKNPIALQREREAREAQEKRKAEHEREKEKRAMHYRKKVKETAPTKRVRMVDEPVEGFSAAELVEPPRTWWGKFMKWLNT